MLHNPIDMLFLGQPVKIAPSKASLSYVVTDIDTKHRMVYLSVIDSDWGFWYALDSISF